MHRGLTLDRHRLLIQALFVLLLMTGPACAQPAPEQEGFEILDRGLVDGIEQAYLSYPSDGLKVTGWLFVNPSSEHDIEPCVIFNHGGVGGVGEGMRAKCRWLAEQGYIVFAPSYRGEDDGEGEVEVAAGEVDDVVQAMLLLKDHPGIRPGEFVLLGTSHGALISMHAAARPELGGQLKGVVAAYGVMDIYAWYQHLLDNDFDVSDPLSKKVYGDGPEDRPEAFAARHALPLAEKLLPAPVFLVQGARDDIIPSAQATSMLTALREVGRLQDRAKLYEHGAHGFLFWDDPKLHSVEELRDAENAWHDILTFMGEVVGAREAFGG